MFTLSSTWLKKIRNFKVQYNHQQIKYMVKGQPVHTYVAQTRIRHRKDTDDLDTAHALVCPIVFWSVRVVSDKCPA